MFLPSGSQYPIYFLFLPPRTGSAEFHQIVVQECDSPQPKEFVIRVLGGATADDEDQPSELHIVCVTPLVKQTWVAALQQQCIEARNRVDAVRKSMCAPPKLRSPPPT